jgi:hypothetical protein
MPISAWTPPSDERRYGLSRSLYRMAASCARRSSLSERDRLRLVDACEYALQRLGDNPESGRVVARWLYREVHAAFALEDRPTLCATLRRMIDLAAELVAEAQREQLRPCSALTRSGRACRRPAHGDSEFCPSHRHLKLIVEPGVTSAAA